MNRAYLLLGGNIGDRLKYIERSRDLIAQKVGVITKKSEIFITAAWGNTLQPDFYNQAIELDTVLKPTELLNQLLKIEEQLGRIRNGEKWQERIIDIDILFYNDEIIDEPNLKIPHPLIQERKFVLTPMMDIAKELIHPVFKKSITQLFSECKDALEAKTL